MTLNKEIVDTVFNHSGVEETNNFSHNSDSIIDSPLDISRTESSVLQLIREYTVLSKVDIADKTGFSRSKVNVCINSLFENEIITGVDLGESTGGRPSVLYGFNDKKGLLLGADIGASSLDLMITTFSGRRLARASEAALVSEGPDKILGRVCELFSEMLKKEKLNNEIIGIGMGVPGPVDFRSGMVVSPHIMPGWDKYPIIDFINERFPYVMAVVDNDVNIMAIGEHAAGKASGMDNFIFVKVGTGIGAGIIVQGQIFRGTEGCAGDIGHICVDKNGPICSCGNIGCLESLAGGAAISRVAIETVKEGISKILKSKYEKNNGKLEAEDVGLAAKEGDQFSIELIRDSGRLIGDVLAGLVNFANPQMIVIGGGVSKFGNIFLSTIRQTILNRSLPLATKNLSVVFSSIPDDAGVIGAINLAMDIAINSNQH